LRRGAVMRLAATAVVASLGCEPASEPSSTEAAPTPATSAASSPTSATTTPATSTATSPPAPAFFRDVAAEAGIDFTLETRLHPDPRLPEIVAGGGAAGDFDGDGRLDLYLVQATGAGGNRLFRNLGDWRFEDVTDGSGAADATRFGMGAATGDYDGDGDLDLHVTNLGRDTLLRNDGGMRFTDVTEAAGLDRTGFGASATFFDADGDGDLDLFVTNYVDWSEDRELDCRRATGEPDYCAPARYERPSRDVLYRNDGDGTFTDVSESSGIASAAGTGLGVAALDADGDGRLDLFVANDGMPDHLWMNRGDLHFEEVAPRAGCDRDLSGVSKAGMGVAVEDVDDDGDPDVLVCNLGGETDSFHRNEGGRFVDVTSRSGLAAATRRYTRFGLAFLDVDLDGRLDLYAATGRVGVGGVIHDPRDPYAEPDLLMLGGDDGRFRAAGPEDGFAPPDRTSRGLIVGDFDDDGRLDLVVVDREQPTRVLRNLADPRGRSLTLDVRDERGGPALGAMIRCVLPDRTLTRWVRTDSSYLTARDPRVHLGLGPLDSPPVVEVVWPDGRTRRLTGLALDGIHRVDPPAAAGGDPGAGTGVGTGVGTGTGQGDGGAAGETGR